MYPHPRGGRKAREEISLGYLSALLDFRIFPSSSQSWNLSGSWVAAGHPPPGLSVLFVGGGLTATASGP